MAWKDSIYSEGRQTCLVKHSERQKYKKPKFVSVFWSVLHWSADGWPYTGRHTVGRTLVGRTLVGRRLAVHLSADGWPYSGWQTGRLKMYFLILKVSVSKRVMFFEILRNIFRKTMLV